MQSKNSTIVILIACVFENKRETKLQYETSRGSVIRETRQIRIAMRLCCDCTYQKSNRNCGPSNVELLNELISKCIQIPDMQ